MKYCIIYMFSFKCDTHTYCTWNVNFTWVGLAHACSNVPSCCPTGISLYDGLCIEVNSSSSPWFGARLSCFQRGGDLASLHDIHPSSLDNQLQSGTEYWTGLTNGQWIWQDSGKEYQTVDNFELFSRFIVSNFYLNEIIMWCHSPNYDMLWTHNHFQR